MKKIHDYDRGYAALYVFLGFVFKKFFRQMEVRGLENIPKDGPVLLAPNHQQGLMDPLSILFNQKKQMVFLARADIFSSALIRSLLRFLKIAPIYRIRDGYENLAKNDEQMKLAVDVLTSGKTLCLMPEGNHGRGHKLRPFVKGLFRIAFTAEEQLQDNMHVRIVPVNIDYNHYEHAGSDLVVCFGQPIDVKEYLPLYQEHQATGLKVLRDVVFSAVSQGMVDIRGERYELINSLCSYGTYAYLDFASDRGMTFDAETIAGLRFDARRELGLFFDRLETTEPKVLDELEALSLPLESLKGSPDQISEMLETRTNGFLLLLVAVSSLILTPGFLLNTPVWLIIRRMNKKIKDVQMRGSFSYGLGLAFSLVFYLLVALILSAFLVSTFWEGLLLYLLVCLLGIYSESARQSLRIPWRILWYSFGKRKSFLEKGRLDYQLLKERIRSLLDQMPEQPKDETE